MATSIQIEIANKLGINLKLKPPRVAAAMIEDHIFYAIYPEREKYSPSINQIEYAKSLGIDAKEISRLVLSALIAEELEKRNKEAIIKKNLLAGDNVIIEKHGFKKIYTISSIGKNYRLWFKGGNGRGAWTTQVKKQKNK